MPRVGKAKRLRRQARLARGVQRDVDFAEMAASFRAFMAERGIGGTVVHDDTGVWIVGGGANPRAKHGVLAMTEGDRVLDMQVLDADH